MARKGKDLFVLLGERLGGGSKTKAGQQGGSSTDSTADKARGDEARGAGFFGGLFRTVQPRQGPRRGADRRGPMPRGLLLPGWMVALLLLTGLGVGFLAGRWSAGDGAGEDLNVNVPPHGQSPGPFADGPRGERPARPAAPGYLPPEKAEERIYTHFFLVLNCAASQREQAAKLASYLRENGLETTRITKVTNDQGASRWLTLCYVRSGSDGRHSKAHAKECFHRLKRVPLPGFEPRFAAVVTGLESADDVLFFSNQ